MAFADTLEQIACRPVVEETSVIEEGLQKAEYAVVVNSRLGKPPPLAVRLEEAMPSRRAVLKCLQRLRGYVTGRGALWSYRGSAPLFRWLTT